MTLPMHLGALGTSAEVTIENDERRSEISTDEFRWAAELNLPKSLSRRWRCTMPDVTVKSIDDMEAIYGGLVAARAPSSA